MAIATVVERRQGMFARASAVALVTASGYFLLTLFVRQGQERGRSPGRLVLTAAAAGVLGIVLGVLARLRGWIG